MYFKQLNRFSFFSIINNHLINYPTPLNITYFWSFGLLSGVLLGNQILTGIILVMHYTPSVFLAFQSIEHIMRDVNWGWFLRYLHANGASVFFFLVYIHIGRGFYYGSFGYPRMNIWATGILIFILMMATAFLGYVLPWGQMSFWGATVITNLFTAFPIIGNDIAKWLWGGFSVGNPTLNRFFSLHYILPFVLLTVVILHLYFLHIHGSSNPLNLISKDFINFYPYFYIKDLFSVYILFNFFLIIICFFPNLLLHPDNYNIANSLSTPEHIVPEWYFLSFYAMLRSIPDKLGGVIIMFGALISVLILPYLILLILHIIIPKSFLKNSFSEVLIKNFLKYFQALNIFINLNSLNRLNIVFTFKYGLFNRFLYTVFILSFILLTYLGGQPIYTNYVILSQILTFFFFFTLIYIIYKSTYANFFFKSIFFIWFWNLIFKLIDKFIIYNILNNKYFIKLNYYLNIIEKILKKKNI